MYIIHRTAISEPIPNKRFGCELGGPEGRRISSNASHGPPRGVVYQIIHYNLGEKYHG